MKKKVIAILALVLMFACGESTSITGPQANQKNAANKKVRSPAVAGTFYPADRVTLEAQVELFLKNAEPSETKGMITALVLPHAGYQFSGQVAAYGFKKLIGEDIDTVIIIGNSHHARFEGISVYSEGSFRTPLGDVEIDTALANALIKSNARIVSSEAPHAEEHSLEVEIPFLQKALKKFKIVPILFGNSSKTDYQVLAKAVAENIKGKNVLVIASSDLSHYPDYKGAKLSDEKIAKAVLTGSVQNLDKAIAELEAAKIPNEVTAACGEEAIKAVMEIEKALGADRIELLAAANSGDVAKDKSRVVGYAAIGFFAERRGNLLNKAEQKKLLEIAKTSVEAIVNHTKAPIFQNSFTALDQKLGAFVTLRENGQLRGCIGRFSPADGPLYQIVSQMAAAAATEDPRFSPVSKSELGKIEYEISVLSLLQKIEDPAQIVLGKNGVRISKGMRSGVFLPQVATETGWDLDHFMGELCSQKAGLASDCWKNKDTQIYTFTAQVF